MFLPLIRRIIRCIPIFLIESDGFKGNHFTIPFHFPLGVCTIHRYIQKWIPRVIRWIRGRFLLYCVSLLHAHLFVLVREARSGLRRLTCSLCLAELAVRVSNYSFLERALLVRQIRERKNSRNEEAINFFNLEYIFKVLVLRYGLGLGCRFF